MGGGGKNHIFPLEKIPGIVNCFLLVIRRALVFQSSVVDRLASLSQDSDDMWSTKGKHSLTGSNPDTRGSKINWIRDRQKYRPKKSAVNCSVADPEYLSRISDPDFYLS
jgi:hypothetical protein